MAPGARLLAEVEEFVGGGGVRDGQNAGGALSLVLQN
jgi:hypothetical protein